MQSLVSFPNFVYYGFTILLYPICFLIGVSQPRHYRNLVNTSQTSQQEYVTPSQQYIKKEVSTPPPGPPPPSPPYCEDGKSDTQDDNTAVIASSQRQFSLQVLKNCVNDGTDVSVSSQRHTAHHMVSGMKDVVGGDVNNTSLQTLSSHQSISNADDVLKDDVDALMGDLSNGGPSLHLVQNGTCKDDSTKSDAVKSSSCASVTSRANLIGTAERSQQLQVCVVSEIE